MSEEDYWLLVVGLFQRIIDSQLAPITVTDTIMIKAGIPLEVLQVFVRQGRLKRCRYINGEGYLMPRQWQKRYLRF